MYSVFLPADLPECMDYNVIHLLHFGLQLVTLGGLGPDILPDLFPVAPGKEIGAFEDMQIQLGCIPFSQTFFGFGQSRLFGFSC